MNETHETLSRLMEAARNNLPGVSSWSDLARAINVAPNVVSNWKKRGVPPQNFLPLSTIVGCSPEWIAYGTGEIRTDSQREIPASLGSARGNISAPPRPIVAVDDNSPLDDDEIEVQRLSLVLSAGSGRLNWEIDEKGTPNRFRKSWCKRKGLKPEKLVTVPVEGDSMSPTIPDGSSVTINTEDVTVRNGKPHAIDYMGEFYIKRLFRQPDQSILVRSDNPDKTRYPDWTITTEHGDALRIIGAPVSISADLD